MRTGCWVVACLTLVTLQNVATAGKNIWTSDGPFGGTITQIVFDPRGNNLILAAGPGSVFRSLNNGKTWQRTDALSGPVVIHPKDPDRILAGDGGVPIFLSTDKGKSWQVFAQTNLPEGLSEIVFHPQDPQLLYGITFSFGVFKSTDGGLTWVPKNKGLDFNPNNKLASRVQIEIDFQNGKTLYAAPANGLIFRSTNGGESWKKVAKGLVPAVGITALQIDPKNPKIVFAGTFSSLPRLGIVYKTTNGGNSWTDTKCLNCSVFDIAVDPKNSKLVYVSNCGSELVHSTDGGNNWLYTPAPDPGCRFAMEIHPKNSKLLMFGRNSFGIERSTNGGKSWRLVTDGLDAVNTVRMEIHADQPGQIYAHDGSALYRSNLFGKSFQSLSSSFAFDLDGKNANTIAMGGDPAVLISNDGGKTFVENRDFDRCPIPTCIAFHTQRSEIIYLIPQDKRDKSNVWPILGAAKSTDRGETFKLINTGLTDKKISVMSVASQNGDVVYLGTETGKIFRTTNAGKNWKNISAGLSGSRINSIAVHPTKISVIFATDLIGNIFKSTDGGNRWTRKFQQRAFIFNHIAVDPRDVSKVYAASGPYGFFLSLDEGEQWSAFSNTTGLGNFAVMSVAFPPGKTKEARASLLIGTQHGVFSFTSVRPNGQPIDDSDETVPLVEDIDPDAAVADEIITIEGKHFGSSPLINFKGARAIIPEASSDTSITVRVPPQAQIGNVTVVAEGEEGNGARFVPLPASGRFLPTEGPSEGGYEIAIIDREGFARSSNFFVSFGGKILSGNDCPASENIVTCTVPRRSAGEPSEVIISLNSGSASEEIGTFTFR